MRSSMWTINTQQSNKLPENGVDFFRISVSEPRTGNFRNYIIRQIWMSGRIYSIGSNWRKTVAIIWTRKGNARKLTAMEDPKWKPDGIRRTGRPKERWLDGWRRRKSNRGMTEEDTGDTDLWKKKTLFWVKTATVVRWAIFGWVNEVHCGERLASRSGRLSRKEGPR